jgi:hypothetical protein
MKQEIHGFFCQPVCVHCVNIEKVIISLNEAAYKEHGFRSL